MSFRRYTATIRRWLLFGILPAILVSAVAYKYAGRSPKMYSATVRLYVQQATNPYGTPSFGDAALSQELASTYADMVNDPVIAPAVDRAMARKYPGYRMHGVVASRPSSSVTNGSQLFTVSVQDTNPYRAADAANAVATAFINRITSIQKSHFATDEASLNNQLAATERNIRQITRQMSRTSSNSTALEGLRERLSAYQTQYQSLLSASQQFKIGRDSALNSISIYSPALPSTAPISPHPSRTAMIAALIALLVAGAGIYVYDYLDDSFRSPEEIEEVVGAPVLGAVEQYGNRRLGSGKLSPQLDQRPTLAEAYRVIRTNLQFTNVDRPPRTVVVTSPSPAEGKSTTASNLARVLAQGGAETTLIDGDMRRPSLHKVFGVPGRQEGLTNMLVGVNELNGAGTHRVDGNTLTLVTAGPPPPNPADLLNSRRMRSLLDHFQSRSDMVIVDSPPVLAVADAAILSTEVDGVLLVIDIQKSTRRDVQRTRESIEAVGGKILGVVINRLNPRGSLYYYYYSHYEYQYRDTPSNSGGAQSPAAPNAVVGQDAGAAQT